MSSGEILSQALIVNALHAGGNRRGVTNVVLMGSGEPLDNYENVFGVFENVSAEGGSRHFAPQYIAVNVRAGS